jgi:hypothetical protein
VSKMSSFFGINFRNFENPATFLNVLILGWMKEDKVKCLRNKDLSEIAENEKSVTNVCRMCDVNM